MTESPRTPGVHVHAHAGVSVRDELLAFVGRRGVRYDGLAQFEELLDAAIAEAVQAERARWLEALRAAIQNAETLEFETIAMSGILMAMTGGGEP